MVTTLERKQRIYQICSEHDIVIIEDDPYYYLQYSLGSGTCLHVNIHVPNAIGLMLAYIFPKLSVSWHALISAVGVVQPRLALHRAHPNIHCLLCHYAPAITASPLYLSNTEHVTPLIQARHMV